MYRERSSERQRERELDEIIHAKSHVFDALDQVLHLAGLVFLVGFCLVSCLFVGARLVSIGFSLDFYWSVSSHWFLVSA